jgi:hypothetical protein
VFTGSGDIGSGGANAYGAVTSGLTIVQNINTLVPGSAEQYLAVGNAAVTGIGFQAMRTSPRVTVGP